MTKSKLLLGASALIALAVAGGAHATTEVFGGGSTLIGPYLRQVEDCYGSPTDLVVQGSAAKTTTPYAAGESFITANPFFYGGTAPFNCGTSHVDTSVQFNYLNAGSGNGELGVFTHDITTDVGLTTDGVGSHIQYTSVQYGMGDYGIGASEVNVYNSGSTTGTPPPIGVAGTLSQTAGNGAAVHVYGPGDTKALAAPTVTDVYYHNPHDQYGAFIQFPISVDPVAVAYAPVYKAVADAAGHVTQYSFHIKKPNKDASGGLLLDMATLCGIFNGQITLWSDPALTALNGGLSLKATNDAGPEFATLKINLFGRADSSGTTSILYRALAAQCNPTSSGYAGANNYAAGGGKKLPSALLSGGATPIFTTATGSSAVATLIGNLVPPAPSSTALYGNMGYLGTDYVLPAVLSTGANTYGINVADIKPLSTSTVGLEPTEKTAVAAFGKSTNALLPPQSSSSGVYTITPPADSKGLRSHPEDWAEPISTTVSYEGGAAVPTPLADPNHNVTGVVAAYPLVGTTNAFLNTCYADATVTAKLAALFNYYETTKVVNDTSALHPGVLVKAGLAPLPKAWTVAINATFITPQKTTAALNLNILQAGTGPASGAGSQCKAVTPGA
jgi:phosphate transport system substrate-binding protein